LGTTSFIMEQNEHTYKTCNDFDCELCDTAIDNGWLYACSDCLYPIVPSIDDVYMNSYQEPICVKCENKIPDMGK